VHFAIFRLDTPYACEVYGGQSKGDPTRIDPFWVTEEVQGAPLAPPPAIDPPPAP
jgi:hypothetical protein